MGIDNLRKHLEAERRWRRRGHRFFHASPFQLNPGMHLKPKWCRHQLWVGPMYTDLTGPMVWMTTSLPRAREIARETIRGPVGFIPDGFAGGTDQLPEGMEDLQGAWIYQVKPLGPVLTLASGNTRTPHPVRILRVAERFGEPRKNPPSLRPPVVRDEEAARMWVVSSTRLILSFPGIWESIKRTRVDDPEWHLRRFRRREGLAARRSLDDADWRRVHDWMVVAFWALRDCASEREAEERYRVLEARWQEEELVRFRQVRRRGHQRRAPRRKYRRIKSLDSRS